MQFTDLKLIEPLLRAVRAEGYTTPTPIQVQAIPHVLAGRDMIGCAQTGTGKTAAFALPILQGLVQSPPAERHGRNIRVLVLSPTRELATQIAENFNAYGRHTGLRALVIYGGVGQNPQVQALRNGVDILVATPGRLLDLMSQSVIRLDHIEVFVLDEADRMFDMGFIHDVRRVVKALPTRRQTLLFSATMAEDVQQLARQILIDPVHVEVTPQATTVEKIRQSVFHVEKEHKRVLLEHLLVDKAVRRALVFTRTKHGANKLAQQLTRANIPSEAIHGNKSQSAREKALSRFKAGSVRVLVATDIAARGIDIDDVTHVINYDLPNEPESYVHRIGRTARAGAEGIAFSFCGSEERPYLKSIEKLIRLRVPVVEEHPYLSTVPFTEVQAQPPQRSRNGGSGNGNGNPRRNTNGNSAQGQPGGSSGRSRRRRSNNRDRRAE